MAFMTQLTPRSMVLYIFKLYPGELFSVKQIQEKILRHFEYVICRKTIIRAIDEGKQVNGNIIEEIERRGMLKHPVKVFTITYQKQEN